MTVPTIQFEARVRGRTHRKNKSGDWVSATFEISPVDLPKELWEMDEGQRVMIVLAKIGDDETPEPVNVEKYRKGLRAEPRSKQAQKLVSLPEFQKFIYEQCLAMPPDSLFDDYRACAAWRVKSYLGIESSNDLDRPELAKAHREWDKLYDLYEQSQGRLVEQR